MANPFDQFDVTPVASKSSGVSANPFDKFDTPATRQNVSAEPERTLGGFAGNVVKSGSNFAGGLLHAVANPVETVKTAAQLIGGGTFALMPEKAQEWAISVARDPAFVKQSIDMAKAVGGQYAKDYGSVEGLKNKLYTDPVGVAADLSTIFSMGSNLASKAGMAETATKLATAADVTNPLSVLKAPVPFTKATIGEIPVKAISKTANVLADIANPKAAAVLAATEGKAPEIVNALRTPTREFTPGYQPTAAELTTDLNLTKFPAAQAEWSRQATTPYYQRNLEQNAALLAPLSVESTTIPMAEARRTGVTAPMYEKALAPTPSNFFPETSAIKSNAETKLMQIDSDIAKVIRDNPSNPDLVTQLQAVQKNMRDAKGNLYTEPKQISSISEGVGKALDTVKDKFVRSELTNIKDAVYGAIPEYAAAQKKFAELSKPINQAEVANYLKTKLASSIEAEGKLTPAQFAGALENVPGTVKNATGLTRVEDLGKVLEPEQIDILNQIKGDITNKAKMEAQAKAGGKGFDALEAGQLPKAPHIFSKAVSIANDIISRLQGKIDRKMAMELAIDMLDPQKAAQTVESAWNRQQNLQLYKDMAAEAADKVGKVVKSKENIAAGQIQNALTKGQQEQNQNALAR